MSNALSTTRTGRRFFLNLSELIPRGPKSDEFYSAEIRDRIAVSGPDP
jgi:hypothetical protein